MSMLEHFQNDKSTVFSIVPFLVNEFKPGLYPGSFKIPPCLNDKEPNKLIIQASEHMMHMGDKPKPIRIVTPSYQIADSVVKDFLDGQLWCSPDAHPGIAWLAGDVSPEDFKVKNKDIYDTMREVQQRWYVRLCRETDNEWKKYENSRVVSDQAKFAARVLGLEPAWMTVETVGFSFDKCPACGTPNNQQNAVCSNCRCILNEDKYKKLKFAAA